MEPIIDHIQITVKDMSIAVPFYDKLLALLGFDVQARVSATIQKHEFHVVEYTHPRLTRLPSLHREALSWARRSIAESQVRSIILRSKRHLAPKSTGYILS
jgi:hypothetical protein